MKGSAVRIRASALRPDRLPASISTAVSRRRGAMQARRDMWTPVAGVLAAVTFVVGLLFASDSPDTSDPDAKVLAWYADHGHRVGILVGGFLLAFCGLF